MRAVGPLLAGVGLLFLIVGIGSFFASFGGFEPPRYFWCAFVGAPLLVIGLGITQFAYLGAFTRFVLSEQAPVAKDTFNYMAESTKGGVKTVASAVGEGLAAGINVAAHSRVRCRRCNQANDVDAKFCKSCGASLAE
jgi:hypothetical protein